MKYRGTCIDDNKSPILITEIIFIGTLNWNANMPTVPIQFVSINHHVFPHLCWNSLFFLTTDPK